LSFVYKEGMKTLISKRTNRRGNIHVLYYVFIY